MEGRLREQLDRRRREGTLRALKPPPKPHQSSDASAPSSPGILDFASNDYLGLARCRSQHDSVQSAYRELFSPDRDESWQSAPGWPLLGATGSRLLSGDSPFARSLEAWLALIHDRPAALLFNSGYDANLSVLSSLPFGEEDAIVMDELAHNSLVMGARMGRVRSDGVLSFRHNDVSDLKRVLEELASSSPCASSPSSIVIVVESVYSMDGDIAPLRDILDLAQSLGAGVMVDEAHGLGVYGRTNARDLELTTDVANGSLGVDGNDDHGSSGDGGAASGIMRGGTGVLAALGLEGHPALMCSVHTFGKAAGCHGAVVAGSSVLVSYLINYARPFVYSTALPPHSLVSIRHAYESMMGPVGDRRRAAVFRWVRLFREAISSGIEIINGEFSGSRLELLPSPSPIQAIIVPGNKGCVSLCEHLRNDGNFDIYPIRSPTVAKGKERIRIILHSHNSEDEVLALIRALLSSLRHLVANSTCLKLTSKL